MGEAETLRRIVADSATLWDRLNRGYSPEWDADSELIARQRLARWKERAARGDAAWFAKRLAWLNIQEAQALEVLGRVRAEDFLPAWTRSFASAMDAPAEVGGQSTHPFGDVLSPFVAAGRAMVSDQAKSVFSTAAWSALEDDLLRQLSYV